MRVGFPAAETGCLLVNNLEQSLPLTDGCGASQEFIVRSPRRPNKQAGITTINCIENLSAHNAPKSFGTEPATPANNPNMGAFERVHSFFCRALSGPGRIIL